MDENYAPCRDAAFLMLTRREHSCHELRNKLAQKAFDEAIIEQVIAYLQEKKYQCDVRYCEMLIKARVARGYGPGYIQREIATHHIESDQYDELFATTDWESSLQIAKRKKTAGRPLSEMDFKTLLKFKNYLYQRGFNQQQIESVMDSQEA